MTSNLTCVILAGGKAQRLLPLSAGRSKAIVPFMNRPLLGYLIHSLVSQGFHDILLTTRGRNGDIESQFGEGGQYGASIKYHTPSQSKWYGTAGLVKNIVDGSPGISDPFFVIYGDSLLDADFNKLMFQHTEKSPACTILYHRPSFEAFLYEYHDNAYPRLGKRTNYGVCSLADNDRIVLFEEKPLLDKIEVDFERPAANAAVYLVTKSLLDHVPPECDYDFGRDLFPHAIASGVPIYGCNIGTGYRLDLGNLPTYFTSHMAVLDGRLPLRTTYDQTMPHMCVEAGASIEDGAHIDAPALIGEGATVRPGACIRRSVIGARTVVEADAVVVDSILHSNVRVGRRARILGSIICENCTLEDEAILPPSSVLGAHSRVGAACLQMPESDFAKLV